MHLILLYLVNFLMASKDFSQSVLHILSDLLALG